MEKYGYIYKFTFLPKRLIYVGQKKGKKFVNHYYGSGVYWNRIISGCDKEKDIKREILEWCYSKEELDEREKYWIEKLGARDITIGCNIAFGGDGGDLGEDVRKRISKTMRERGSQRGQNNAAYGKHWYTNGIVSVLCKDCPEGFYRGVDESIKNKRNNKLRKKCRSEEQKQKYRISKLGDKNPMKSLTGKNHPNYGKFVYKSPDGSQSGYFLPGEEPDGWIKGMKYRLTKSRCGKNNSAYGKHWYNNGVIQVFKYECPDGFVKGMLKKVR